MRKIVIPPLLFASIVIFSQTLLAFGVDFCFTSDQALQNCINIGPSPCRQQPTADPSDAITCRIQATAQSLSGLTGNNTIIGGRNSVHTDATFLMAQLIGFTPWQAYQMAIYSEATDQAQYIPFDQNAKQMLSDAEISTCNSHWGQTDMPYHCLAMTPYMSGIYKFNAPTGGMLLHLHARSSSNGSAPPELSYPAVYLAPSEIAHEQVLRNLSDWIYDRRYEACAGGITKSTPTPDANFLPCESTDKVLNSPMNFFATGFSKFTIPFVTNLGPLIINQSSVNTVYANDDSFGNYIAPQQIAAAKFGIFLHSYEDRYSHHMCTDNSYFYRQNDGNYTSTYDSVTCAQGSHFWWHVLEQGTTQTNIEIQHRTIYYALSTIFDEMINYANHLNINVTPNLDKTQILNNLVNVIQVYDPQTRLTNMVTLMENTYHIMPLPGHGSYADKTIDQWLAAVSAPMKSWFLRWPKQVGPSSLED